MNIPDKLKVGGKIYTVEKTDKLDFGYNYLGETVYCDLVIRIRPNQAKAMQEVTFLHEMLHTIFDHLGYKNHNEKKIDELANVLHMIIVDNPGIFEKDVTE